MNQSAIVSLLWGAANPIRDTCKHGNYQDVNLPLTVLCRLDCVLADTQGDVLKRQAQLKGNGLEDLDAQLRRVSGFAFYNTSRYDFEKLLASLFREVPGSVLTLRIPGADKGVRRPVVRRMPGLCERSAIPGADQAGTAAFKPPRS